MRNLQQASRTELICKRLEAGSSTCNSVARCLPQQHALPRAVLERKTKTDRNLTTVFFINEKLNNLKLHTRSDLLVARYDFLVRVSELPKRMFLPLLIFSAVLRRIHTYHAVPMPFSCHAVLLRV
jgi:carboxypeptidase C (cathepsin A)